MERQSEQSTQPNQVTSVASDRVAEDRERYGRAAWMVFFGVLLLLVGFLDQMHARLFCLGNAGITVVRMVLFGAAVVLALTSVAVVIPGRRWRILYAIGAFFVGFWLILRPDYYVAMRTDVSGLECAWKDSTQRHTKIGLHGFLNVKHGALR